MNRFEGVINEKQTNAIPESIFIHTVASGFSHSLEFEMHSFIKNLKR